MTAHDRGLQLGDAHSSFGPAGFFGLLFAGGFFAGCLFFVGDFLFARVGFFATGFGARAFFLLLGFAFAIAGELNPRDHPS